MKTIKLLFSFKVGMFTFAGVFALAVGVLALAPRSMNTAKSENCSGAPTVATLNPFPVSWGNITGSDCTDAPAIAIRNVNSPTGSYSSSVGAQAGDEFYIRIYVHNGAQQGLDYNQTTAFDVQGGINISGGQISTDFDGTHADGSLTNTVYGSVSVNLPQGAYLELVSGSQEFYASDGISGAGGSANLNGQNGTFSMGDMQACFEFSKFLRFKVRVVAPVSQPTGSITASIGTKVPGQCLLYGTVSWQTSGENADPVQVKVKDLTLDGPEQLMAAARDGSTTVDWIEPGHLYRFNLYILGNYAQAFRSADIDARNVTLDCGAPPAPKDFTFSMDKADYCVGDIPRYTINATSGFYNQAILWSSTKGGASTGENFMYYGHNTNGSGFWTGESFAWGTSDIGNWVKTAAMGKTSTDAGVSKTFSFSVRNCSAPPPPPPAVCPAGPQIFVNPSTFNVGQTAQVSIPSGWQDAVVTSNDTFIATVSGLAITGRNPGTALILARATAPNGATNCNLTGVSIRVNQPTPPPAPVCPTGVVFLNPSIIYVDEFSSASAPAGWTGGTFYSSNSSVARIVDGTQGTSIRGLLVGTASISGSGFSVGTVNGTATNCALGPATITVRTRPVTPPAQFTATATATASATAYASCPNGTTASASATATATATATASTQADAERLAYERAFAQAQASAYAQAQAKVTCGTTPPPPPPPPDALVCTTLPPLTVNSGQIANFRASGGNGTYSWSAYGGSLSTGSGANFGTAFVNNGSTIITNTVFVTSGSQTEDCQVHINPASTPPPPPPPPPPNDEAVMELTKTARNVTDNGSFAHTISAKQGDEVEYKIFVRAGSAINLRQVRVTDELPIGFTYIQDSLRVNSQPHAPGLTTGGLVFDVVTQSGVTITYRGTVSVNSGTLTNFARATAENAPSQTDRANINVVFVTPGQPTLTITKEVRNLGPSQTTGFSSSINAKKNDTVQYKIVVRNVGSASANNAAVSDSNPLGLSVGTLTVSKSYSGSVQTGIVLGNLAPLETVTITYDALVTMEQGSIQNIASVSASNAATERAIAIVNVIKDTILPPPPAPGGNCNNSSNSCNNNTNNNNQTNNNSTNSSNQSNQNNINGNNNTVTNSNQNCVNNSCNYTNIVYINQAGNTVPGNEFRQLGITKLVRNTNGGAFQDSVTVNSGDTVEFEVIVRNTGNQVVNNVRVDDTWNGNLNLVSGTVRVDGNYSGDNLNSIALGSILSGQQKRITFQARVNASGSQSIQNTARASGDSVSQVQDDAWVFVNSFIGCTVNCGSVQGGSVNLVYSKRARNDTKNADATSVVASKEDYITYTLTVTNSGNTPATNFVITDDLSQVLPYADMADNGGGILSGNVISYPGITVPAGGSVSKSFRVRVKFHLAANLSYTLSNTYGNTVVVRVNNPQVLGEFIAPKTGGPSVGVASVFGSLMAGALAVIRNRRKVWELITD